MDTLQRAKASRRGGRSFVMKLFTKAETIMQGNVDSLESVSTEYRASINLILSQLTMKKLQLEELDRAIPDALTAEQDLEDEIGDAEIYQFGLTERMDALRKFSSSPPLTAFN